MDAGNPTTPHIRSRPGSSHPIHSPDYRVLRPGEPRGLDPATRGPRQRGQVLPGDAGQLGRFGRTQPARPLHGVTARDSDITLASPNESEVTATLETTAFGAAEKRIFFLHSKV